MSKSEQIPMAFRLVLQMQVPNIAKAGWTLIDRFGFKAERGYLDVRQLSAETKMLRLRRLDQVIELVREEAGVTLGHGPIDHLSMPARDVDAAVMAFVAKWGKLDPDVTPDGAVDLPMFWDNGVRFAFVRGPYDARIEFCQNLSPDAQGAARLVNIGGHDHIGIRCKDLDETAQFYKNYGFNVVSECQIDTPEGPINIRFIGAGPYLLELSSTPQSRAAGASFAENPVWSALIIESFDPEAAMTNTHGPNGERIISRAAVTNSDQFHFDAKDLS